MIVMKEQSSQPCDLTVKSRDLSTAASLSTAADASVGGSVIKRKARESLEEEFDEDEEAVTSSSGAVKPGKRSRKEGSYHVH